LSAAKLCLLTPERKAAYDATLRTQLRAAGKPSSDSALSGVVPVRAAEVVAAGLPPVVRRGEDRWRTEEPATSAHTELAPVPIPMPASPAMPVVRRGVAALVRSRRQQNTVPLLITIISLIVLLGGAGIAVVVVGNRLSDEAGASSDQPTRPASKQPAARTE
jgi:hypothetical protein